MSRSIILIAAAILTLSGPAAAADKCKDGKCPPPPRQGQQRPVQRAGPPPRPMPPVRQGPAQQGSTQRPVVMGTGSGNVVVRPPYAGRPPYPGARQPSGGRTYGPGARTYAPGAPRSGRRPGYRIGLAPPRRTVSGRFYSYRGRSFHPFAVGRYRWPRGYYYRHYAIGWRLPLLFLIPSFFIYDYDDYGVAPPPYGYQWVRYGPDMLLVDTVNGQVVDAVYGAFEESDDVQDMPPDAPYPDDDPNAPPPPQ
ncbi:MAG TPA: RcnB family protein [Allosphingosinicella sp.]|nr:RcnB family protein [Allosphingosinicella sp.]